MSDVALIIFLVTYVGVALGEIPGLAVDRTGFALLGAIAMVATGVLHVDQAVLAVDMPTIVLLYSLMVVSAQLRLGGFYTWAALRISRSMDRPRVFLLLLMLVSAGLSALLVNDIICLTFTPVLAVALLRAGLNPVPFLIGLAVSSNIGSAATIIGNPQNMLIGQLGHLHFASFLAWCAPPAFTALAVSYALIVLIYRRSFRQAAAPTVADRETWPALNPHQARKGLVAVLALIVLFFTPIPRELTAITLAGLLLCSRKMQTRWILGLVDWHLITLFIGLFVVIAGIEATGLPQLALQALNARGIDIQNMSVLTLLAAALSNVVSNVPATMLLVKFIEPSDPASWYALALATTFAGNLITIGSIANLITIEQAKEYGIRIRFGEHARVGVPVTLASLLITLIWIRIRSAPL